MKDSTHNNVTIALFIVQIIVTLIAIGVAIGMQS